MPLRRHRTCRSTSRTWTPISSRSADTRCSGRPGSASCMGNRRPSRRRSASWNDVPYRFEGGTPNIAGAIGLGAAVDYLTNLGMESVRAHEMEITQYALDKIGRINGVTTYGPKDVKKKAGVLAFTIDNAHPHDVASILDVEGICIRSGHHCAQPLMERYDLPATARASFYVYNDLEDVDVLAAGIKKVQEVFA